MPTYKLTYFGIEAAAEKVRLAFTMTGTPFEDNRINFEQWGPLKPTTPYGQLPILEVDGKVYSQSYAMLRYAGKLGDGSLYPVDKQMEIDEVVGLHEDMARAFSPALYVGMRPAYLGHNFADDDAGKAAKTEKTKEMREKFLAEELPKFMGFLAGILEKSSGPYFCGDKVTIADLCILPQLRYFTKGVADFIPKDVMEKDDASFKKVMAWINTMMEVPQIKEWYAAH